MKSLELAMQCHAVGDALGYPFEFKNPTRGQVRASLSKITPIYYTDDTQLMLATVVGLAKQPQTVEQEYVDWFSYQGLAYPQDFYPHVNQTLGQFDEYRAVRAPGVNTLQALGERLSQRWSGNDSNGNGTVMRMLPFAFLPRGRDPSIIVQAQRCAQFTHGGTEIDQATQAFLVYAWTREVSLPESYIKRGGRTALDCLSWAIKAVETSDTFEDCLVRCIAHEGDSDTLAAVAGGLWAIHRGRPPQLDQYLDRLQGQDALAFATQAWERTYGP